MGLNEARAKGARLHIIVVHGIGPHQIGYSDELVDNLMRKLGAVPAAGGGIRRLPPRPPGETSEPVLFGAGAPIPSGGPQALLAVRRFRTQDGKQIFTYEITWAPIVDPLKQALTYDVSPAREKLRARVNRKLKRNLIDERLADPVIYLGYQRSTLQYPVAHTICSILGGEVEVSPSDRLRRCELQKDQDPFANVPYLEKTDRIAIITQSLGSKITFDVLTQFVKDPLFADKIRGTLTTVFMLANQLPLLELADRDPLSQTTSLGELAQALSANGCNESQFGVVAVSDPNDLLSFDISDTFALRTPNVTFANVQAQLGKRYVGFAVDPLGAHVNHELSEGVLQLIVDGHGNGNQQQSAACQ